MKKTISITLGGAIFNIEEDGYNKLKAYFDSIKEYFSQEGGEILDDIEARAAEKFAEKISAKKKSISLEDVDEFIASMGTIEDISGEEKTEDAKAKATSWREKKLYRDADNAVILGVAAGIANYLGIDPIFVRLAFIASLFFGGAGVLIYIILYLIIPEAKSYAQKMQMHGQPVNLANLKEAAEEKLEIVKKKYSAARPISRIAETIVSLVKKVLRLLIIIFSILIFVGTVIALIGIFFAFGNFLLNSNLPHFNFPEKIFLSGIDYYIAITAAFFAAFIPVLFAMFVALSLLRKRLMLNWIAVILMLMVWIVALATTGIYGTRMFLKHEEAMQTLDNSEKITKKYDIRDFQSIVASGSYKISVIRGEDYAVEVLGHENYFDKLKIENNKGKLEIDEKQEGMCIFCYDSRSLPEIFITLPTLEKYSADGMTETTIGGFEQENMTLTLNGASRITADLQIKNVKASVDGISKLSLKGQGDNLKVDVDGASKLDTLEFEAKNVTVKCDANSDAHVWATEKLNAKAYAASVISYKGNPEISKDIERPARLKAE